MKGSILRSTARAVAWRVWAASVTRRSLDVTVSSRACTFWLRAPAWDF